MPVPPRCGYHQLCQPWTDLNPERHAEHTRRLLAPGCADPSDEHVRRPGRDDGACYRQLLAAAQAGDLIAYGWLATTHRPLLYARGAAIAEVDRDEWASAALEALATAVGRTSPDGAWARRRISLQLVRDIGTATGHHLDRRTHERPDPAPDAPAPDPAETVVHLGADRLIADLETAVRDGFLALARGETLQNVADRHGLAVTALRQRLRRARRSLRRLHPDRRVDTGAR